ncbi:MAG: HypC/HybG/HupF family hydrogenase formation chaperone, partial [Candidatus Hodarchaeales archaeon]
MIQTDIFSSILSYDSPLQGRLKLCLAIPAKIIKIIDDNFVLADFGGVEREINIGILGEE